MFLKDYFQRLVSSIIVALVVAFMIPGYLILEKITGNRNEADRIADHMNFHIGAILGAILYGIVFSIPTFNWVGVILLVYFFFITFVDYAAGGNVTKYHSLE